MAEVKIEYCVPCGHLGAGEEIQHRLLETYGQGVKGVRLKTGHGGVLVVRVGDEVVFDKHRGDAYDVEGIVAAVGARLGDRAPAA